MFIKYTAIELRQLLEYLEGELFYLSISWFISDGIDTGDVYGSLEEYYPEVAAILFTVPLESLPLYVGGDYSKIVAWRLRRGV